MAENLWQRLKRSMGIEEPKPEPRKATPSEQQALDRAIPRRFEKPEPPKPKPVKPAKEADVESHSYDFRKRQGGRKKKNG